MRKKQRLAISPVAVSGRTAAVGGHAVATVCCRNLRPDFGPERRTVLRSVGRPLLLSDAQLDAVGVLPAGSGEALILLRDPELFCLMPGEKTARSIGLLDGSFYCATQCGRRLVLSHSRGMSAVEYVGGEAVLRPMPVAESYHGIALRAVHHSMADATAAPRRLSREYQPGEVILDSADLRSLGNDISDCYRRLCASARGSGSFIQPLIARYRVYDSGMNELYCSAPVLLCHPDGVQCTDAVSLRSNDRRRVESYTLTAQSWRIVLDIPQPQPPDAAFVAVSVLPQLHPYDPDAVATAALVRSQQSDSDFGRLVLPGADVSAGSANIGGARARLMQMIARTDMLETTLATYSLATLNRSVTIECGAPLPLAQELSQTAGAQARTPLAFDVRLRSLAPPNRFSARRACAGPAAMLWGGLVARRYGGCPLTQFAATVTTRRWEAWIKVNFSGGGSVLWRGSGNGDAPQTIGPILSYPSADAVNMVVGLKVQGEAAREQSFSLVADPSLGYSVYIHPTLLPFRIETSEDGETRAPAALDLPVEYPDLLAIGPVESPQALSAVLAPGKGDVRALAAAGGSQSAWDFGRSRFYAFCSGGILALSTNDRLSRLAATPVDSRVCAGMSAVTVADGSVWAVASGDLIRLQANKAVTERSACGYTALAWCGNHRELLGVRDDGSVELTAFDHGGVRFEVDYGLAGGHLCSPHGKMIAYSAASGIYNLAEESADSGLRVEWTVNFSCLDSMATNLLAVAADISAENFSGTLELTRRSGSYTAPAPDCGFRISGPLRSPVGSRILARPARDWQLSLRGTATEFSINEIVFIYERTGNIS
ncbi:MAG: hypothetical protein K2I56_04170 [Muribaculaceae bacterium]|nr:hypothetical protein [Muribaculaceae bacterium]